MKTHATFCNWCHPKRKPDPAWNESTTICAPHLAQMGADFEQRTFQREFARYMAEKMKAAVAHGRQVIKTVNPFRPR